MKNTILLGLAIVLLVIAGLLAACGPSAPPVDGAALLSERCTVCHTLDRVKQAKKTQVEWAQTVTKMVGKGAKLNADEQAGLVGYLAKTYGP